MTLFIEYINLCETDISIIFKSHLCLWEKCKLRKLQKRDKRKIIKPDKKQMILKDIYVKHKTEMDFLI